MLVKLLGYYNMVDKMIVLVSELHNLLVTLILVMVATPLTSALLEYILTYHQ